MEDKIKIVGSYSNGENVLIRVCKAFKEKIKFINKKREENGSDSISGPKITELILRHKDWINTEEDIVNYNSKGDKK